MASEDEEYEYDYSDDEDYLFEEDDGMDWNPVGGDNPNAAPVGGKMTRYRTIATNDDTCHRRPPWKNPPHLNGLVSSVMEGFFFYVVLYDGVRFDWFDS